VMLLFLSISVLCIKTDFIRTSCLFKDNRVNLRKLTFPILNARLSTQAFQPHYNIKISLRLQQFSGRDCLCV
jgi:hypothetical protein